jgi:hypothetical protein
MLLFAQPTPTMSKSTVLVFSDAAQPFHLIAFYIFIACGSRHSGDSACFWYAISLPYQP